MDPGGPIIGIDLGTTVSAISFLNGFGRAEIIPNRHGDLGTPSVVLFPAGGGRPLVGREARERSAEHPERLAEFVKREMGDPDWRMMVDGRELTPPAISAVILSDLLDTAEAKLGERPRSAVITCPAYFGDLERQHTADAGRLAGLEVLSVFNEPTAAALAYGLHHAAKDERIRALVYDLGGGTFDVTVLELLGRRVRVLSTAGEHRLGGKDWDDELVNYVAEEFLAEHGEDPRDDPAAGQDLRNRCEAAKVSLSSKTKANIFCRAFGKTTKVELTRKLFDELTRPLLEQTRSYVDQVLQAAQLGWTDLDVILPVGGSSHMPQVREMLSRLAGRVPETVIDPELSVAQGAAYYAALVRSEQGFEVKVMAPPTTYALRGQTGSKRPASLDEVPEVLSLPGKVAEAEPVYALGGKVAAPEPAPAPPATYAVAAPRGSAQGPQVLGALRGRVAGRDAPAGGLRGRTGAAAPPAAPGALRGRTGGAAAPAGALRGRTGGAAPPAPARGPASPAARQPSPPAASPGAPAPGRRPPPPVEHHPGALRGRQAPSAAPLPGAPAPLPEARPGPLRGRPAPPPATGPVPGAPAPLPGPPPAAPQPPAAPAEPPWWEEEAEEAGDFDPFAATDPGFDAAPPPLFGGQPDLSQMLGNTMVYDFADIVELSEELPPEGGAPQPRRPFVVNVNARSLGVLVFRDGRPRTSVMIRCNSPLPASHRSRFVTINDNQTAVKVVVLEGDNPDPEANTRIGECIISGLPPRPRGQQVEIVYSYDADGRIHVLARDVATNQQAKTTLHRPTSLTESEEGRVSNMLGDGFRG